MALTAVGILVSGTYRLIGLVVGEHPAPPYILVAQDLSETQNNASIASLQVLWSSLLVAGMGWSKEHQARSLENRLQNLYIYPGPY